MLTTFHVLRDLLVALLGITCRIVPADSLTWLEAGERMVKRVSMTCDVNERLFQFFLAIIVLLIEK